MRQKILLILLCALFSSGLKASGIRAPLHGVIDAYLKKKDAYESFVCAPLRYEEVERAIEVAKVVGTLDGLDYSKTALHLTTSYSASPKKHTVMRKLIEAGASVDRQDCGSFTPLHGVAGAESFDLEALQILVEAGATIDVKSMDGTTALSVLVFKKNENRGDDARLQKRQGVRLLLDKGADPTVANSANYTCLHMTDDGEIARMLIEKGADINARMVWDKHTPLHEAAQNRRIEVLKVFLEYASRP